MPEQILAKVPLLKSLKDNPKAISHLAALMKVETFPRGHRLIIEGELGDQFFVLIEGEVSVFKNTPDGDSYKVVILKAAMTPGIGEGGMIEAEPRSATVVCDTECKCLVLNREGFANFCSAFPSEAVPVLKSIAITLMGRLRQTSHDLMLLHKALMHEIRG